MESRKSCVYKWQCIHKFVHKRRNIVETPCFNSFYFPFKILTIMHSSRMRTTRSLTDRGGGSFKAPPFTAAPSVNKMNRRQV